MINVLVVDDSAFMRKALSMMLESDPEVRVVDTARDGLDALEKVQRLQPDVVTLDVEMPRMDGITALKHIMKDFPRPVLMVSSLTKEGAETTIEALQAGAVDFIPKQFSYVSLEITKIQEDLIAKVKTIARSRSRFFRRAGAGAPAAPPAAPRALLSYPEARLIAIGISTGGPFALQHVLPALPADLPVPVAIVQHMPPHFTRSLAERLNTLSRLRVVEAEPGMRLEPGLVVIAAGGRHLTFRAGPSGVTVATPDEPSTTLHRPSVDVMFQSANEAFGGRVLAAVMTGMGRDGLEGARLIKRAGGRLLAQDEPSCVVYGMPRAVVEAGLADAVLPLDSLAAALAHAVARPAAPAFRTGTFS
jgi:two-component system chemotaxis response regulator CheB